MNIRLHPWLHLSLILGLMLAPGGAVFANVPDGDPAASEGTNARVPILLPEDRFQFEEKTLPSDFTRVSAIRGLRRRSNSGGGAPNHRMSMADSRLDPPTGLRIFTVRLNPKEKIEFRLKAEDLGYMRMVFSVSRNSLDMKGPIRIANLALPESRRRAIKIQNATSEPQEALLCISGQVEYAYKLEWTRIPLS